MSLLQILENFTDTKKKTTDVEETVVRPPKKKKKKVYQSRPSETKEEKTKNHVGEENTVKKPPANKEISEPEKGSGLKSIKKIAERSQQNGQSYQNLREKFAQEDLMKYWNEYLDMLYRGNDKNKFILMSKADPQVEGEKITLHFESEQEVVSFQPVAENLLKFLKKNLRNGHISFSTKIVAPKNTVENQKMTYYTRETLFCIISRTKPLKNWILFWKYHWPLLPFRLGPNFIWTDFAVGLKVSNG